MVSEYHSAIQKGIISAGKELIKLRKIKKIYEGNKRALSITDSHSKHRDPAAPILREMGIDLRPCEHWIMALEW